MYVPGPSSSVCSFLFGEDDFKTSNSTTDRPLQFQNRTLRRGSVPSWNLRGDDRDQRVCTRLTLTAERVRSSHIVQEGSASAEQESQDNDTQIQLEGASCCAMDEQSHLASDLAKVTE